MLIKIDKLQKRFKTHEAVRHISFQIEKGRCVALLGPNGAGKTTTLQMLAGLLTPTAGSIDFAGSKGEDYRSRIGFLPQHPAFFNWMSPVECLQFVGKLSNIPKSLLKDKIAESLQFVNLYDVRNKKTGGFSGGMKQRLGIAQAILHEPEFLILDEPVSALDPAGRRDVLHMIERLKGQMTILFSTHVLHDAEQVCDEVIMMKDGEIKWDGTLEALKEAYSSFAINVQTLEPLEYALDFLTSVERIQYRSSHHAIIFPKENDLQTNEILLAIVEKGLTINRFEKVQDSLEEAYMKVMNQ